MALNLKLNKGNRPKPDYRSADIIARIKTGLDERNNLVVDGKVTHGTIDCSSEGSGGWAISELIEFPWIYINMPTFTWGLDGSMQVEHTDASNLFSESLPTAVAAATSDTYSPAIYVPRVIHWYRQNLFYLGAYLLVIQLNPDSTETDKIVRLHYRFEGPGIPK